MVSNAGMYNPDGHRCAGRSLGAALVQAIQWKYGIGYRCDNAFVTLAKAVLRI